MATKSVSAAIQYYGWIRSSFVWKEDYIHLVVPGQKWFCKEPDRHFVIDNNTHDTYNQNLLTILIINIYIKGGTFRTISWQRKQEYIQFVVSGHTWLICCNHLDCTHYFLHSLHYDQFLQKLYKFMHFAWTIYMEWLEQIHEHVIPYRGKYRSHIRRYPQFVVKKECACNSY